MAALIVLIVLVLFVALVVAKSVALVPQAEAAVIERLGRYARTVSGQLTFLIPSRTASGPRWICVNGWCRSRRSL